MAKKQYQITFDGKLEPEIIKEPKTELEKYLAKKRRKQREATRRWRAKNVRKKK